MKLFFAMLVAITLNGCFLKKSKSSTKHFSSFSSGYNFEVEGEISLELPDQKMLEQIILWNIMEQIIRHPNDALMQQTYSDLMNPDKKEETLKREINRLNLGDPVFWIKEQLKYSIIVNSEKVPLSVNETSLRYKRLQDKPQHFSYTVSAQINPSNENYEALTKMSIYLPLNPLTMFFSTNTLQNIDDIEKTRKREIPFPCFVPDGDPVASHNYFFYLDPYTQPKCLELYQDKFLVIKQPKIVPQNQRPVYPEYHELFADGRLDVLIAFNEVDSDKTGYRNWLSLVRTLQYSEKFITTQEYNKNDVSMEKIIKSADNKEIKVTVRLAFYEDDLEKVKQIFLENGIAQSEIIVYVGHSGYGADLFDIFNSKTPYPKEKYQIFFPYSCSSYSYAVTNILTAKALMDLDLENYYTDVISTAQSAAAPYDFPVLNAMLSFFLKAAENYESLGIKDFTYQKLLQEMDNRDAQKKESKAIFTVAGEERNVFDPNVHPNVRPEKKFDETKTLEFLMAFIADETRDFQIRQNLITKMVRTFGLKVRGLVMELMKDKNPQIRMMAVNYLAYRKLLLDDNKDVIDAIINLLKYDQSLDVKYESINALAKLGVNSPAVSSTLLEMVQQSPTKEMTDLAVYAFGQIGLGDEMGLSFMDRIVQEQMSSSPEQYVDSQVSSSLEEIAIKNPGNKKIAQILFNILEKAKNDKYYIDSLIRGIGYTRVNEPLIVNKLIALLETTSDMSLTQDIIDALIQIKPQNSARLADLLLIKLELGQKNVKIVTLVAKLLVSMGADGQRAQVRINEMFAQGDIPCYTKNQLAVAILTISPLDKTARDYLLNAGTLGNGFNESCTANCLDELYLLGEKSQEYISILLKTANNKVKKYYNTRYMAMSKLVDLGINLPEIVAIYESVFIGEDYPELKELVARGMVKLNTPQASEAKKYIEEILDEREDPYADNGDDDDDD